jgi:hypothetical protein
MLVCSKNIEGETWFHLVNFWSQNRRINLSCKFSCIFFTSKKKVWSKVIQNMYIPQYSSFYALQCGLSFKSIYFKSTEIQDST